MGLLVGMVFYPIISASRRHQIITWVFRIAAIPLAVVLFVVLIRNFYTSDPYAGASCQYLQLFSTPGINCVADDSLLLVPIPVLYTNIVEQPLPRVSELCLSHV
jgi:hypothetical protein